MNKQSLNIKLPVLANRSVLKCKSRMTPSRKLAICGVAASVLIVCSLLAVEIPAYAGKTAVVIV